MKRRATSLIKSPLAWQMAMLRFPFLLSKARRAWWYTAQNAACDGAGGYAGAEPRLTFRDSAGLLEWRKKPSHSAGYSIADLENVCVVERKNLSDLVRSLTTDHANFVSRLKRMSAYPHKLLVITAALSSVK